MALLLPGESLDDLIRATYQHLFESGTVIHPGKGKAVELSGVTLELLNPLARLSRTQTRGHLFSSLGEVCWYLSGSSDVEAIAYYLHRYHDFAVNGEVPSGYGPRLRNFDGFDQLRSVVERLKTNPSTRRAVIQIFDHEDMASGLDEVPCTCTLQFLSRPGGLELIVYMRSNDAYIGLPHDVFAFTVIQEYVARMIGAEVGVYTHIVGSMHLYSTDSANARTFLGEGWQSRVSMPEMPSNPADGMDWLLGAERTLRSGVDPFQIDLDGPDAYWSDLACLLAIFSLLKHKRNREISKLKARLHSTVYDLYIDDKVTL